MKNKILSLSVLAAVAIMASLFTSTVRAQGFDPARFREQQMERYRSSLDVKSDADWTKIEALIGKVMDTQNEARMGLRFGGFGGGNRRPRGDGDQAGNNNNNRNRFGGPAPAETEALEKATEEKASAEDVKAKLAKFREARKAKEAAYEKAQEDLRKALTPRQEAAAVLAGLLK